VCRCQHRREGCRLVCCLHNNASISIYFGIVQLVCMCVVLLRVCVIMLPFPCRAELVRVVLRVMLIMSLHSTA
jgi:hypothetical protein